MASKKRKKTETESVSGTIKTSRGLRDTLFGELDRLRAGETTPVQAREVARLSNVILNTVKAEIEAARFVTTHEIKSGEAKRIPEITL